MTAIAQPQTLGDLLKYEAPNLYSRETDTVAAGQKLALGTVVGRDTTSTKLKAFDTLSDRHFASENAKEQKREQKIQDEFASRPNQDKEPL